MIIVKQLIETYMLWVTSVGPTVVSDKQWSSICPSSCEMGIMQWAFDGTIVDYPVCAYNNWQIYNAFKSGREDIKNECGKIVEFPIII